MQSKRTTWYLCAIALHLIPARCLALIIDVGDGSGNTTAPSGDKGWSYVGSINSASNPSSVTYISDNWFITANHVWQNQVINSGLESVLLNGSSYNINTATSVKLGTADLRLFQVTSNVTGLDGISIATATTVGSNITMIGSGLDREASSTRWYVDTGTNPYTWSESDFAGSDAYLDGYKWASTAGTKRWGSNKIEATGINVNGTTCFSADFDSGEAMGATYDSGGGVFTGSGNGTELAGIMITIGTYSGQPGNTSVFGDLTYIADLSAYADEIYATIPEPATLTIFGTGLFGMISYRRRREWLDRLKHIFSRKTELEPAAPQIRGNIDSHLGTALGDLIPIRVETPKLGPKPDPIGDWLMKIDGLIHRR